VSNCERKQVPTGHDARSMAPSSPRRPPRCDGFLRQHGAAVRCADGKQVVKMEHDGLVQTARFSPDSKLLATASNDQTRLFDTANGRKSRGCRMTDRSGMSPSAPTESCWQQITGNGWQTPSASAGGIEVVGKLPVSGMTLRLKAWLSARTAAARDGGPRQHGTAV